MMFLHGIDADDDVALIYSKIGGYASVCAPIDWTAEEVEGTLQGNWQAIDRAEYGKVLGLNLVSTPNPCEHSEKRQHWFLRRREIE